MNSKLVPGHEIVGVIFALGKNVQGFQEGDRCVADNSASVRSLQNSHAMPVAEVLFSISVKTAFTAEGEGTCYARTLPVKVSQCTEGLRNLSLCMHLFSHFADERGGGH